MFRSINERMSADYTRLVFSPGYARIVDGLTRFKHALSSPGANLMPHPLLFDLAEHAALSAALRTILAAQQKVVNAAMRRHGRESLMALMGLNPSWVPLVDWDQLTNGLYRTVRADVLATADGLEICELNFSAAVGGFEMHEHFAVFARALGLPAELGQDAPGHNMARMYARNLAQSGHECLHLLDWSTHARMGYPSADITRQWLAQELPGFPIEVHDELSWQRARRAGTGMRTLVHRRFTYDDVTENAEVYREMLDSGVTFSNGLEAELLMSKAWLALLWEPGYRQLLTPEEIAAIDAWVVPTALVGPDDRERVTAMKDTLLFKKKAGYGGKDAIIGREAPVAELWALLERDGLDSWVSQPLRHVPDLVHMAHGTLRPTAHCTVLGLYMYEGTACGLAVRSATGSRVVNAGSGASSAWAPALDGLQRDAFSEAVRRFSRLSQPYN